VSQVELACAGSRGEVVALEEEAKSAVAIMEICKDTITSAQTGLADAKAQSAVLKPIGRDLVGRSCYYHCQSPGRTQTNRGRISVSY